MTGLQRAFLLVSVLSAGACGSSTEQGDDNLPAPGTAAYAVDYIDSGHDTTFNYTASAVVYANTCIYLQTLPGQDAYLGTTRFLTREGERPNVGEYALRGLAAPIEPNSIVVYSIYNGYSSEITGSISILRSTGGQIGGSFDFSAPTEGRTPDFTVRIHGSFLAIDNSEPQQLCP